MALFRPLYGCMGYLYDSETGSVVRIVRGEKQPVETFYKEGEEMLTLPNGKPVRVKSLLRGRQK